MELRAVRRLASESADLPLRPELEGTRERILTAALRLFAEHGFEGVSIRDIAAAAQIQSASLYFHFTNKERILAELTYLGHEEHHNALVHALVAAGSTPSDQLVALVRTHVLVHCRYPTLAVVANNELHALSAEAGGPTMALRGQSERLLLEVLQRGSAQGDFSLVHLEATAAAISAMGLRVCHWYPSERVALSPEELAQTYAELALRMVGAQA